MAIHEYSIGDTLTFQNVNGEERTVKVTERYENVRSGNPGFSGVDTEAKSLWGYDHNIIRVSRDA